jgi:hypothetical protein
MTRFSRPAWPGIATLILSAVPSLADTVLATDDGIIRNALCVGSDCPNSISTGTPLTLRSNTTSLFFDDTSTGGFPANDWRIVANSGSSGGASYLAFQDATAVRFPFVVEAGARANALYVGPTGNVGLGTSIPVSNLHIHSSNPGIRLEYEGAFPSQVWNLSAGPSAFVLRDGTGAAYTPFIVSTDAPTASLSVEQTGIGLGTSLPEGKLHTYGFGTQLVYFESADGNAVQVRFRTDSENRRFLAVNNANEVKSQIVFGDDQIQFLGETVAQEWLRISAAGIVSSGPTCNPNPCDATFDPEAFTVPPIEERAAYMWEHMHLPAVGPTAPGKPFNVTEKMGGVIHELEVAHIYIEQLHGRIAAQDADKAELHSVLAAQQNIIADLAARLEVLETR